MNVNRSVTRALSPPTLKNPQISSFGSVYSRRKTRPESGKRAEPFKCYRPNRRSMLLEATLAKLDNLDVRDGKEDQPEEVIYHICT